MRIRAAFVAAAVVAAVLSGCSLPRRGGGEPTSSEPTPRPLYARPIEDPLAAPAGGTPLPRAEFPSVPTPGRTLVVATTGDDAAAGTIEAPLKSIHVAIAKAAPGDTIVVRAGRYSQVWDEGNAMFRNVHGRPDAWIKLTAYPGERPILDARPAESRFILWRSVGFHDSSYIEVRGFEIVGTADTTQQPTTGFETLRAHHIRIVDNVIHDVGGGGVSAIHTNHLDVLGNVIYRTSYWNEYQSSGISSFQADNIGGPEEPGDPSIRIERNIVHSVENRVPNVKGMQVTDGNCIIIDMHDERAYTGSSYIANNVCFNNGGRGINVLRSRKVLAVNNSLHHNNLSKDHDDEGELSAVYAEDVRFVNNIVEAAPSRKAVLVFDSKRVTFERNLFVGANASKRGNTDLSTRQPVYADPDKLDFRLLAGSPALAAAEPEPSTSTDFTGARRSSPTDLGALPAVTAAASRPASG